MSRVSRVRKASIDEVAVGACLDGRMPYISLGQWERITVVRRLHRAGLNDPQIAARLSIDPRSVLRQRHKTIPTAAAEPVLNYTPEDGVMCSCTKPVIPHDVDEVAEYAQNLCDDLAGFPDVRRVLANARLIAECEPWLAAQMMVALAAWVPVDDTVSDRVARVEQLRLHRQAELGGAA